MASHKSLARLLTLVLLITFLVSACGDDRRNQRSHTLPEAEYDDAFNQTDTSEPDDHPWEGRLPEECRPAPRGKIPSADEPDIANRDKVYDLELSRWNIANNATNAKATTDGLNAAIAWAHESKFGTVRIPAGHYLVGNKTNDQYTEAIKLPGNIALVLDDAAIIEMAPNNTWNYCVIEISGKTDVIVSGGTIRGERDAHTFHGGGLHMANTRLLYVTGNTFHDCTILGTDVSCLTLDDNAVNYRDIEPYKFRNMLGTARGNLLNGEPFDLPMTHDEPFTNSPPHMW